MTPTTERQRRQQAAAVGRAMTVLYTHELRTSGLRVLLALRALGGEQPIGLLAEQLKMEFSVTANTLRYVRESGLIEQREEGRRTLSQITERGIQVVDDVLQQLAGGGPREAVQDNG
jgi:DNA-binding transcriptional ArsR family regulator